MTTHILGPNHQTIVVKYNNHRAFQAIYQDRKLVLVNELHHQNRMFVAMTTALLPRP